MKTKRMMIILLAVLMLMSLALIGCRDRNNDNIDDSGSEPGDGYPLPGGGPDDADRVPPNEPQQPNDPFAPPIENAPRRPGTEPFDPDAPLPPPPERNPDGSIG